MAFCVVIMKHNLKNTQLDALKTGNTMPTSIGRFGSCTTVSIQVNEIKVVRMKASDAESM